jgi:ribosomal protein L18E
MNYLALIQGGIGPDVWDREICISAVDFLDAAKQAVAKAEELGGQVVSLEQNDV